MTTTSYIYKSLNDCSRQYHLLPSLLSVVLWTSPFGTGLAQTTRPTPDAILVPHWAEFTRHSTGKQHQMKSAASCKTMNAIYLIQRKTWGPVQYVGETGQALHCRMNNHQYHPQEDWLWLSDVNLWPHPWTLSSATSLSVYKLAFQWRVCSFTSRRLYSRNV